MSGDLHLVKGQPDADELAAVLIALDLVRARRQEAQPVSRWRASVRWRSVISTRELRRRDWRSAV